MTAKDLRELLRNAAAAGGDAVELSEDSVVDRIRRRRLHRRLRNRRLVVGGVAVAVAAVVVGVVGGTTWFVGTTDEQPPAAASLPLRIITSDYDGPSGMEAGLQATLTADANGCVRAGSGQSAVTLVWPRGYTVQGDANSFKILDRANNVVARSGTPLAIGGGGADGFKPTWTGLGCAGSGPLWLVGEIHPSR